MFSSHQTQIFQLLAVLRKRKFWILVPILVSILAALGMIRSIPNAYKSSTMIMVEPQKIPTAYVRPTVTAAMQDRLRTIEQQIMNRENLEWIVREMGLYPELVEVRPMEAVVAKVRRDLTLEVMGNSVFRIFFRSADPQKAAATANRIAELFIEENLRLRSQQAHATTEFLDDELEVRRKDLEEKEHLVARFRLENQGILPEQTETITQALEQLRSRLEANRDATDRAEFRRLLLERDQPAMGEDSGTPLNVTGTRLREARSELLELSARYTDQHPDILRLRRVIEELEGQFAIEGQSATAGQPAPERVTTALPTAQMLELEQDFNRLEQDRRAILREIRYHRARLEKIPQVALELQKLTRDYDNMHKSYQSMQAKRIDAQLAESLELKQQSEQFIILEKAVPPAAPYSPNRSKILLMGIFLGGIIGLGLALFREETDRTLDSESDVRSAFPAVRLLGSIPRIEGRGPTPSESSALGLVEPTRRWATFLPDAPVAFAPQEDDPLAAECCRQIAVQIEETVGVGSSGFVLGITGVDKGAGKTTTALNLALALARAGDVKVLFVEADVWQPGLSRLLEVDASVPGLVNVLERNTPLQETIVSLRGGGLDLIRAGRPSGLDHLGDLVTTQKLSTLFSRLRTSYRYIVVDMSAVVLAGGRATAAAVDASVVVVRSRQSPREAIERGLSVLGPDKTLGIVVNDDSLSEKSYYGVYEDYSRMKRRKRAGARSWLRDRNRTSLGKSGP